MIEIASYRLRKLVEDGVIKYFERVSEDTRYEVNKYYWCGYWEYLFKVLNVSYDKYGFLNYVEIMDENGNRNIHATSPDPRMDFIIELNEERNQNYEE